MIAEPLPSTIAITTAEAVVVVHGWGGKRLWMYPLCARLRARGFQVINWSYNSLAGSIEDHARKLRAYLDESLGSYARLHIVAHSMGAIVVRSALIHAQNTTLGRIVLLAPPNRGTPVARMVAPWFGIACRAIPELSDRPDSFVNKLPQSLPAEVGVIAARHDLLVPAANTHFSGQCDHVLLHATHNSLLLSHKVADLTTRFLNTGCFTRESAAVSGAPVS